MKNFYIQISLILVILVFQGCKTSKGTENSIVRQAIILQSEVIHDPLFYKILMELESEGTVDWQPSAFSRVEKDLNQRSNNTKWILDKYMGEGGYNENTVLLWRKWNPWSSTTAVTNTCGKTTKLNKWKLDRDKYSIVNTLIHERAHSFCLIHPELQTRDANKCDISYLAGDLSEILALKQNGINSRKMDKPLCPALVEKIKDYNLIELQ